MDFSLNAEQRARFLDCIQRHRTQRRLGQKEVAHKITVAGDLSHEISRFENGHSATVERWLSEPYLPQVARAYGFEAPSDLLRLFEAARSLVPERAVDEWHPAFPGIERATMELPRVFRFAQHEVSLFLPGKGGSAAEAVAAVPATLNRIAVVIDSTSGVDTVRRELAQALLDVPVPRETLAFDLVDSDDVRRLPMPCILVDAWTVSTLLPLVDRLVARGHMSEFQATRARKMLDQVPGGALAGLPISLVIDAVATEARSTGSGGHLHRRLVAAEWERAVDRSPGVPLADGDRAIYTDFWAEIAISSGATDWTSFDAARALAAATTVLARRGWQVPDGAALAARAVQVAHIKSVSEREQILNDLAVELRRPSAERLVEGLVRMGLLAREGDNLRAATAAVASLATAWGIAERPELLRGQPALLCLPRAGDLIADVAAFGARPAEVWAAITEVPAWAVVDRDHAWIRFAAACTDSDAVGKLGVEECWSRVLYERSGHGRWSERIWANANEVRALDKALQTVSQRLRAHLPVFGSREAFIESVESLTRERIDALVCHPIIGDPQGSGRSLAVLAQLAPWQFPSLADAAEAAIEQHPGIRGGLGPPPDPREVAAWACLAGFPPALTWLAGADPASATFGRLPLPARLVAAVRPACSDAARRRAREQAICVLAQPAVSLADLRRPIRLDQEGLPLLHAALGLDQAPRSVWEAAVQVIRTTGGLPPRCEKRPIVITWIGPS